MIYCDKLLVVLLLMLVPSGQIYALGPEIQDAKTIPSYLEAYESMAQHIARNKRKTVNSKELAEARYQAIEILKNKHLTVDLVKKKLDPLFDLFEEALLPQHEEIVLADKGLLQDRQQLLKNGVKKSELASLERIARLSALCQNKNELQIIANNYKLQKKLSTIEADASVIWNTKRLLLGVEPLKIDPKLVAACQDHSKDMHEKKFFSHTSPIKGKEHFTQRAQNFGTTARAENLAMGPDSGERLIMSWWYSPGHLKNMMLKNMKRGAIGQHKKYFTMLLG